MTADYFFEVSWEVCNKVGGIYTVITSKILPMLKYYSNYYAIGPYFPGKNISDKFQEKEIPDFIKEIFENLHKIGITCHFGVWLTEGEPNTILVDYSNYQHNLNNIKKENWDNYKIDSLDTQFHDYDEPILWSTCVGMLLEQIKNKLGEAKIAAQFHEWMAGGAQLYLKSRQVKIGCVFTTHATMLGRTLATNNVDLYGQIDKLNPEEQAYKFNVQSKFYTEKACAHSADAFTTVSEITGLEATHLLGKSPDVLLPNGLDTKSFPTFDDASVKHKLLKDKIKRFLMFYFFPYYQFELDDTLIFFLAGRYEFQNKGVDIFIKALGKLNEELIKNKSEKTIVAIIWVPTGVKEIKPEIMENKTLYEDIDDSVHDIVEELRSKIVYGLIGNKELNAEFLLGKSLVKQNQKRIARFKKQGKPPLCTHNLYNEHDDIVLKTMKRCKLSNDKDDKVKKAEEYMALMEKLL